MREFTIERMKEIISPEVISYVKSYLMARARAETLREAVDNIYREILKEKPVYITEGFGSHTGERITEGFDLYLCTDKEAAEIYAEADKRERANGIKPKEMQTDYCPALVAENLQREVENLLINASGKPIGVSCSDLIGLDLRRKWIDLIVKAVVNMPYFRLKV